MPTNDSHSCLVKQAKSGDRLALERLFVISGGELTMHVHRRFPTALRNVLHAEDIVQQTLMRACNDIASLHGGSITGFVAWLKAIADMRLADALRQQGRNTQVRGTIQERSIGGTGSIVGLVDHLLAEILTPSSILAKQEAILAIQTGLAMLPVDQSEAIQIHLLEGKSLRETALEMNRTEGAIRGLLHRGKAALAKTMGRASAWFSDG